MTWRILHTEWSDGWGGQERRIVAEMAGLQARGHRLWLATRPHAAIAAKAREAGIEVLTLPFSGKLDLGTILPLARLIRQERVDVVNTHSGIDSWVGAFAARLGGCHLVRTRHLNLPLHRRWYNFVHYLADRVVTCGETMRHNLIDNCGFPASQVASIPTGVDLSRFNPVHERTQVRWDLGLAPDTYVVLMVGVIRAVKRHEVALRAFARLRQEIPSAQLLLAGDGPMRGDMEALAARLGLGDSVRFLGHRDDVPDLMGAADCLLLTSRSEGVPQVLTQGLQCGLPVVATAVGGVPEVILAEQTGLLVAAEDIDGVAAALARIHGDSLLAARLVAAGRRHVAEHFSLEAMLDATEKLYADIQGEGRR
ncbi:MAG: glycosyltransferase family 4 protein [Betaproteobacteria bacterium]|nr:glycosyltransferase family 4 protein [Betaproteobacteria bacterium]